MKSQKSTCRKTQYQKVTYEHKLFVIDQIKNGQISVNYASKKYNISRSSIHYWIKKYATFEQNNKGMNKDKEIKKLKEKIDALRDVVNQSDEIRKFLEKKVMEYYKRKVISEIHQIIEKFPESKIGIATLCVREDRNGN